MKSAPHIVIAVALVLMFFQTNMHLQQFTVELSDHGVYEMNAARLQGKQLGPLQPFNFSQVFSNVSEHGEIADPPPIETWLLDDPNPNVDGETNTNLTGIPRTINKIFFQKSGGFPAEYPDVLLAAHKTWIDMNPGYNIRYYDLTTARKYLARHFHPVFLRAFDCQPAFASKSDVFRMTLLYREGGWHSDWKQSCLQDRLLDSISNTTNFFATWDMWKSNDYEFHKCAQNAFVGSVAKHPIISKMLELLLINIQTAHYGPSALDATSTCIFGRAIQMSEKEHNSENFSLVAGEHTKGKFKWRGKDVVLHKCEGCGGGQDWGETGNSYTLLYKHRRFYCEDAASIYTTTSQ